MTVLVSNLGTQNRDFTVLIWVPELLPSRSGMVRFHSQVKVARDKGGRYRCVLEGGIIFIWV